MTKCPIIVDVDQTFVDSATPWIQWCEDVYGVPVDWSKSPPSGQMHYNIGEYFPSPKRHQPLPLMFWEDPFLYDKLRPLPGAVVVLRKLKSLGHPIRFVSYCKNGHFSSKARMLKRETADFLDLEAGSTGDGFYATKAKAGVAGGVIIDDRNEFLNQFADDVLKIKMWTPFTQSVEPRCKYDLEAHSWKQIGDFLLATL